MVEFGVDELADGGAWPPAAREHRYAISDALPLHRLGLVPPPPELGSHLLTASPIEAALAAAEATAELQAIPPPAPEVEEASAELPEHDMPESAGAPAPVITEPEGALEITGASWSDAPLITDPDTVSPGEADLSPADVAAGETATSTLSGLEAADNTATAGSGEARGFVGEDDPSTLALQTSFAAPLVFPGAPEPEKGAQDDPINGAAHAKLMRLDLSRRADAPPVKEMPLPPLADDPAPTSAGAIGHGSGANAMAARAATGMPSQSPAAARPRMSNFEPPAGNWPGFLTGIVMAVAIGVGLYVSLVGS